MASVMIASFWARRKGLARFEFIFTSDADRDRLLEIEHHVVLFRQFAVTEP